MYFHSLTFAIFLAAVLLLDRVLHRAVPGAAGWKLRCGALLVAGFLFYGWWDPGTPPPAVDGFLGPVVAALHRVRFLGLMATTILTDWWVSNRIVSAASQREKKLWLAASITTQLSLLGVFKYWNFVRDSVVLAAPESALAAWFPRSDLVLPIGISFYTFQSMSYTVDVYRGTLVPERRVPTFALFVSFFPQLVAGPIVRAKDFLWQVQVPKSPKLPRLLSGLERFALGLFKKAVIADNLTPLTDRVFADPAHFSAANNAAALLMWSVVIYCDFSGYSDMAIGCARMLGFKFLENFHYPYLAKTVTEFWRRWHISLSEWLRDYLYIPLGGSRHGLLRTMAALALTMLLGGLWHGASWNFVLWGAWWGGWLATAHLWRRAPESVRSVPAWISAPATLAIAVLGWVPFRCAGLDHTVEMLGKILSPDLLRSWASLRFIQPGEFVTIRSEFLFAGIALTAFVVGQVWGVWSGQARLPGRHAPPVSVRGLSWVSSRRPLVRGVVLGLFLVAAVFLRPETNDSFIYFQF